MVAGSSRFVGFVFVVVVLWWFLFFQIFVVSSDHTFVDENAIKSVNSSANVDSQNVEFQQFNLK